jgi:hypothetical protein
VTDVAVARRQLAAEVVHWAQAVEALADLDTVAAPEAWASVERYLRASVRDRLSSVVASLAAETVRVQRLVDAGDLDDVRRRLLRLRDRYLQVETILDFYGDAVNTRTNPAMRALLRGLDTIASDSMEWSLRPLGIEAPPALVYLGEGLGASILRAGVRLWDRSHPSPAAAIKLTRHNLARPTAILHETGHQVAALTGWTAELAEALRAVLAPRSHELAEAWEGWAGEVAADAHAFAQAGWAPLAALANVVDGPTPRVYRLPIGDPHPFPWVRVMLNAAFCRSWFGPGPWDDMARTWRDRHPPDRAPGDAGGLARASVDALGPIVDVCTRRPMGAFGGRPLHALDDPRRVSPSALAAFAARSGPSLLTSSYLRRVASLRVLAWLTQPAADDPTGVDPTQAAAARRTRLTRWLADLGAEPLAPAA